MDWCTMFATALVSTTTFSKENQWEWVGRQFGVLFQVTFYYKSIPANVQRSNFQESVFNRVKVPLKIVQNEDSLKN